MMRLCFLLIGLFAVPATYSQECSTNAENPDSCAQSGKYSAHDKYGKVVFGKGQCATGSNGEVVCSATPDGGAMPDSRDKNTFVFTCNCD